MPLDTDAGDYEPRSTATILAALQSEADTQFDFDVEDGDHAAIGAFLATYAEVLASQQEQSLANVYDASFIDTAVDTDLEKAVERLAMARQDPVKATGTQRFIADGPVTQDHTIPAGTAVRTADGTVTFTTDSDVELSYYDGFERSSPLDDYSGDTGDFSVETNTVHTGTKALASDQDAAGRISKDGETMTRGDTLHAHVYAVSDTSAGLEEAKLLYLVQDVTAQEYYKVTVDASNDQFRIGKGSNVSNTANVSIPHDEWLHVYVTPFPNGDHVATLEDDAGNEITSITWAENDLAYFTGTIGMQGTDDTVIFDEITTSATGANVTAETGGVQGNVAADTLTVMPSPPNGVDTTNNPHPTGDESLHGIEGTLLTAGEDTESDAALRARALRDDEGSSGYANGEAILDAVSDVESVSSVSVVVNETNSTDADGRPPHSFEIIVPASADRPDVARAIYERKAWTSNDVGGHGGTAVSETVTSPINGQEFTIEFSEATTTDVDMTLDVVVQDGYDGDEALRERVVEYVGGVRPDGSTAIGLGIGENVYIDELKERITDDGGIVGFDDANTSFTPSTTTDSNGLAVIDIADESHASVDGTDGSVTINRTSV